MTIYDRTRSGYAIRGAMHRDSHVFIGGVPRLSDFRPGLKGTGVAGSIV